MKNSLSLLIIALCSCHNLSAQIGFGPEAGLGLSTMHFAPVIGFTSASTNPLPAARVGGTFDVAFNKHIYFQGALDFTTKGQSRTYSFYASDTNNDATQQTIHLYYLDLPLNIVVKTGGQGKGRFFVGAGATVSYLLFGLNKQHSKGYYNDTAFNVTSHTTFASGKSTWPSFDVGINLVAGYEWPTGVSIKTYYTAGTTDIGKASEIDKNRIFGVSGTLLFGKGRNINQEKSDLIDDSKD